MAELIHSYPEHARQKVVADLETILLRESKFLYNNMKLGEMIPRLKEKWDHLGQEAKEASVDLDGTPE